MQLDLYAKSDCWSCGGSGQKRLRDGTGALIFHEEPCLVCDGWGRELGPDGVAIMEFLESRFGLTMKKGWPHDDT